jgi:hypothetical protein
VRIRVELSMVDGSLRDAIYPCNRITLLTVARLLRGYPAAVLINRRPGRKGEV